MKSIKLFFTFLLFTFLTFSCTPENEINEDVNQSEEQATDPKSPDEVDEDKDGD